MRIFNLLLLLLLPLLAVSQIWTEDFDGTNTTNTPTWSYQDFCTSRDYLDVVCSSSCTNTMNSDYVYIGDSGNYLGARDIDHNGCTGDVTGETVTWAGINIASCSYPNITYICFSVAETRNMNGIFGDEWGSSCGCEDTWDGNTSMQVGASIDGGGFQQVTAIEAFAGSDTRPGIDVNCDGDAGDAGEPELTETFTQYCFELPSIGATLDLQLTLLGHNTAGEDIAVDNIQVFCEASPATLPGTTLAACTPFVAANPCNLWVEDFEGGSSPALAIPCSVTDSRDYVGIMCLDNVGCANEMNGDYTYSNVTGQFLGARDINGNPCGTDAPVTAAATGIDISTCAGPNTLYLCFDIAESNTQPREGTDTWDGNQGNPNNNSFVTFSTNIDGTSSNIISFAAIGNNNSGGAIDTDCDGIGDGAALTPAFTSYCIALPSLGANLDLSITIGGLNTDGDDVAMDNIAILCTNDVSCLPALVTPSVCSIAPLHTNLTSFEAEMSNGSSLLSWETAQEINNDLFEIEHSTDGRAFSKIGSVRGMGSKNSATDYDYTHRNLSAENNYYRLKQYDFDGSFEYSNVVFLRNQKNNSEDEIIIYPNPANDILNIKGNASEINFYNFSGFSIVKKVILDNSQSNIDVSSLDAGLYLIEIIQQGGQPIIKKFVKN